MPMSCLHVIIMELFSMLWWWYNVYNICGFDIWEFGGSALWVLYWVRLPLQYSIWGDGAIEICIIFKSRKTILYHFWLGDCHDIKHSPIIASSMSTAASPFISINWWCEHRRWRCLSASNATSVNIFINQCHDDTIEEGVNEISGLAAIQCFLHSPINLMEYSAILPMTMSSIEMRLLLWPWWRVWRRRYHWRCIYSECHFSAMPAEYCSE